MEKFLVKKIKISNFLSMIIFKFDNKSYLISRSGYSKQGGFEIHMEE